MSGTGGNSAKRDLPFHNISVSMEQPNSLHSMSAFVSMLAETRSGQAHAARQNTFRSEYVYFHLISELNDFHSCMRPTE